MPHLALNLLVKNGESCLPRMLASIENAIDEIVVVDNDSTDSTNTILQSFANRRGIRIVHFLLSPSLHPDDFFTDSEDVFPASWQPTGQPLLADWAFARNLALESTTADLVLKLDADDELVQPLSSGYAKAYFNLFDIHPTKDYLSSYYDIMDGSNIVERQIYTRMWRNLPNIRWQQPMHEYLSNKTYVKTFDFRNGALHTRDWRDSTGSGTRIPFRNLKTLEWHRLTHPGAMVDDTAAGVLFRYTWATEIACMRPLDARNELEKILGLVSLDDHGFRTDVLFQLGRAYEYEGSIDKAADFYRRAAKSVFFDMHLPSLIQLVTMLDTAERKAQYGDLLEEVKRKLAAVEHGSEIPIGCNLLALAKIAGRTNPCRR